MQRFIRRISSSFLPRPDRPWREDGTFVAYALISTCLTRSDTCDDPTPRFTATSTAPQIQIGRKRRFSVTEPDEESLPSTPKKHRAESEEGEGSVATPQESPLSPTQEGVKEVTKGVEDVNIGEGKEAADTASDATAIPLLESPGLEVRTEASESTGPQAEEPEPVATPLDTHVVETGAPVEIATEEMKEVANGDLTPPADEVRKEGVEGRNEGEETLVTHAGALQEGEETSTSPSVDDLVSSQGPTELRDEAVEPAGQGEDS